jgi:Predicted signal transduction protein with a C-terminal ATPase domain
MVTIGSGCLMKYGSLFIANTRSKILNIRLSYKILICFILITFLPIVILQVYNYWKLFGIITNQNTNSLISDLNQVRYNMDGTLEACLETSQNLYSTVQIYNFLDSRSLDDAETFDSYVTNFKPQLETTLLNHKMIRDIYFYSNNADNLVNVPNVVGLDILKKDERLFGKITADKLYWNSTDSVNGEKVFSLFRKLDFYSGKETFNVMRIDIYENSLYNYIEKEAKSREILVIDGYGQVVTSNNRALVLENVSNRPYIREVLEAANQGYFITKVDENNSVVFFNTLKNGWKVVECVNYQALLDGMQKITLTLLVISGILVICMIAMAEFLSVKLTSRIGRTIKSIQHIEPGKSAIYLEESNDEIGIINKALNSMACKLDNMINDVYISNIRKKEAHIAALQSQINPHFLYNTLEGIRMRVLRNNDRETADMIKTVAKLFRSKLDFSETFIPLSKEVGIVEDYVKIQIYRFKDRIRFINEIDKGFFDYMIPKLTIQPLVENAIIHGLEKKKGGGRIILGACEAEGPDLVITLEDDGFGIEKETLDRINTTLENPSDFKMSGNIGLFNVHDRLRLYFGDRYGLKISSNVGCGTKIQIRLPKRGNNDV